MKTDSLSNAKCWISFVSEKQPSGSKGETGLRQKQYNQKGYKKGQFKLFERAFVFLSKKEQ